MPDEEIETRYYNERTGKEEWRCKHCDRTYACSRLAYPDIISDMINYPDIRITHYPDMISA
ncbi:hypothetical protein IWW34DRAFT_349415 [Fusarium oxysporum f. sp. albedinis]|nr:hypothetical protein IWW34DRAFT_349415 [Fusarium oxysporum f. sp. albedinis]